MKSDSLEQIVPLFNDIDFDDFYKSFKDNADDNKEIQQPKGSRIFNIENTRFGKGASKDGENFLFLLKKPRQPPHLELNKPEKANISKKGYALMTANQVGFLEKEF